MRRQHDVRGFPGEADASETLGLLQAAVLVGRVGVDRGLGLVVVLLDVGDLTHAGDEDEGRGQSSQPHGPGGVVGGGDLEDPQGDAGDTKPRCSDTRKDNAVNKLAETELLTLHSAII